MPELPLILYVALGGAIGSVSRFLTTTLAREAFGSSFPWGTVAVNVIGSFAMGFVGVWLFRQLSDGPAARAFLMVGVLGGFTTFSAFSLDTIALMERGDTGLALLYATASVAGALMAFAAGLALGRYTFVEDPT